MGFHDNVRLEKAYPEYGLAGGARFSKPRTCTKRVVISSSPKTANWYSAFYRYEDDPDRRHPDLGSPLPKRVDLGEKQKVIDYHGDLLLCIATPTAGSSWSSALRTVVWMDSSLSELPRGTIAS